eukprot:2525841-Alexandrium_andersonii.AAC.1
MCIRDSPRRVRSALTPWRILRQTDPPTRITCGSCSETKQKDFAGALTEAPRGPKLRLCLLYTSDAADDM